MLVYSAEFHARLRTAGQIDYTPTGGHYFVNISCRGSNHTIVMDVSIGKKPRLPKSFCKRNEFFILNSPVQGVGLGFNSATCEARRSRNVPAT